MSTETPISAWGGAETKFFFALTPEKILAAVESVGIPCTGRVLALNSMENRVYEVEVELDPDYRLRSPSERFRIVKFYRPGRWSPAQIAEEHEFLRDLAEAEIPVVAPVLFPDGKSISTITDEGIHFSVFPKIGGRSPDELDDPQLERVGRLLARMHGVGAARKATARIQLSPETYGIGSLAWLREHRILPAEMDAEYGTAVEEICSRSAPWFSSAETQRIHGDCHFGNLLWSDAGPFWVDFDDMVRGPCVQDLWLIIPGRDQFARRQLRVLIDAYDEMRSFDRSTLKLIEVLRALRFVHFNAWIAKRWQDPAFPRVFGHFGTERYWASQLADMREQLRWVRRIDAGDDPLAADE